MKIVKKLFIAILLCLIIIPQTGCGAKEPVSRESFCLDTVCSITVYDMRSSEAERIITDAFELCGYYENLFSRTIEYSDVYRINESEGEPVTVAPETIDVINKGIEFGEISEGKFDITIGAVTELWDFKSQNPSVPDSAKIEAAVGTVDYRQVKIEGDTVTLTKEGARLDLGGIAKGYIADRIAEQMIAAGVEKAIINLGGNVVTIGSKDENEPWRIGIERPYSGRTDILGAVEVNNETVTTSGVYERYFEHGGKLYHHVLDTDTGYPVKNEMEAVTIQAPLGMSAECDALGTVLLILGPEKCGEILKQYPDIKVAFVDSEDRITVFNGMEIISVE